MANANGQETEDPYPPCYPTPSPSPESRANWDRDDNSDSSVNESPCNFFFPCFLREKDSDGKGKKSAAASVTAATAAAVAVAAASSGKTSSSSMPYGILCCGPGTELNVYSSSDDESSGGEMGSRRGSSKASVVHWPRDSSIIPSYLSSGRAKGDQKRADLLSSASRCRRGETLSPNEDEAGFFDRLAVGLRFIFSPRQRHRKRAPISNDCTSSFFGDEPGGSGSGSGSSSDSRSYGNRSNGGGRLQGRDKTVLNLAFKETRRLPDVAGESMANWAAGVLRIDLTETGIGTLRGLDAFPNVQTLVLDSNGLLSLPIDCPWVPSLETLWMCNNEVVHLDGLLCQIIDVFPRLTSLALMGNPVWPAAKVRARGGPKAVGNFSASLESPLSGSNWVLPKYGFAAEVGGIKNAGDRRSQGVFGSKGGGWEEREEEAAYRLQVVRRLPGLLTLDCTDVTDEERARAKEANAKDGLLNVSDLMLESEPMTDVEESLPRDTPPTSARQHSQDHGSIRDSERERRASLPDRTSLPSSWIKEPIVMDVGSGWTRMGLAGSDKPSCVFPTVVGRVDVRTYDQILGQDVRVFVGQDAVDEASKRVAQRELPKGNRPMPKPILLHQPMSARMVTNWDDMEELWRYGIEEKMALEASEHPVLMADSTSTTPSEREKATEILFETMTTPAVHMALQPVLALYACGPSSGLVVDIGQSGTQVAPIFDGFVLEKGVRQVGLGGKDVTRHLSALVNAKVGLMGGEEFDIDRAADFLRLEDLKSKVCFVSEDIDRDNAEMEIRLAKSYTLPDGTRVSLTRERYRAPEILFDPGMALREEHSLQTTILDSILACERKTWAVLSHTIILTGGSTEMAGLNRRLQRELTRTAKSNGIRLKFTVMMPEDDHNNTVWVGGSMLASTGALDGLWFTREEYEEYGAGFIHAKFAA